MNFFNFLLGNKNDVINKINFEDVQNLISNKSDKILINTLKQDKQSCLIKYSTKAMNEEKIIRNLIDKRKFNQYIFIYGENSNDVSGYNKYEQLAELGFTNVYLYTGGLFEWLCLQDIYGNDNFPTTSKELDILKFKSSSKLSNYLLTLD